MLASIKEEKSLQQPTFNYWGIHSKIYKLNPRKLDLSGKVGDNCFTWARKKLRSNVEYMKVNRMHLEAGTIGTKPYEIDSQRAIGRAKEKLVEWQEGEEG